MDIVRLHHVGHVVADMVTALDTYRQLGFAMPPPSYPTMARMRGGPQEPFGAANTHADFPRSFVELATLVRDDGRIPETAHLVPLRAPADVLPTLLARIADTSSALGDYLDRFEGLHIMMFAASDVDAASARLADLDHGGVNTVTRPVDTDEGTRMEILRYVELAGVPEGRIGIVAELDEQIQATRTASHPNGAIDLVDTVLCAAAADLPDVEARYRYYLDRPARSDGPTRVFDLDGARVTIVADTDLPTLLPGERPAELPALVAYTVAVRDLGFTENLLRLNGIPLHRTATGDPFVPAAAALGAAIVFTQSPNA